MDATHALRGDRRNRSALLAALGWGGVIDFMLVAGPAALWTVELANSKVLTVGVPSITFDSVFNAFQIVWIIPEELRRELSGLDSRATLRPRSLYVKYGI